MLFDKATLKILRYIYHHPGTTYQKLIQKYKCSEELLRSLVHSGYLSISGAKTYVTNEGAHYYEVLPSSTYQCLVPGNIEVESHQWFNLKFITLQIALPIVIAIITTLITICLA